MNEKLIPDLLFLAHKWTYNRAIQQCIFCMKLSLSYHLPFSSWVNFYFSLGLEYLSFRRILFYPKNTLNPIHSIDHNMKTRITKLRSYWDRKVRVECVRQHSQHKGHFTSHYFSLLFPLYSFPFQLQESQVRYFFINPLLGWRYVAWKFQLYFRS